MVVCVCMGVVGVLFVCWLMLKVIIVRIVVNVISNMVVMWVNLSMWCFLEVILVVVLV